MKYYIISKKILNTPSDYYVLKNFRVLSMIPAFSQIRRTFTLQLNIRKSEHDNFWSHFGGARWKISS